MPMEFVRDKASPKRAKDFVKCSNPKCRDWHEQHEWNEQRRQAGKEEFPIAPHCHPVF